MSLDLALIACLWVALALVINPVGEFPLNDDWSFSKATQQLVDTGEYYPPGWGLMTLLTNVLWGSLFCLPAGCSFTALRLSTLVASLIGLAGCYVLIRDLQQPRWVVLLVTLTLALNPIYFALSYTFMTDVPFTALIAWSAVFFVRSLRSDSSWQMLIGAVLAVAAILSRQIAFCVPAAFALALLLRQGLTLRTAIRAVFPLLLGAAAYLVFHHWMIATGRMPPVTEYAASINATDDLGTLLLEWIDLKLMPLRLRNTYTAALYLGLFLLPILLFSTTGFFRARTANALTRASRARAITLFVIGLSILAAGAALIAARSVYVPFTLTVPSPFPGNIILKSGIGPLTLRDTLLLQLDHVPGLPAYFWMPVTFLALCGALLLLCALSKSIADILPRLVRRRLEGTETVTVFLLLSAGIYLLPVLARGYHIDRHLLPSLLLIAAGLLSAYGKLTGNFDGVSKHKRILASALLAGFGLFAIAGTRDYLEWNRVRWQALKDLTATSGVNADDIDGGFEYNGWYLYDPAYKRDLSKSFWWVNRDTYVISFGNLPNYRVLRQYTYFHVLPPHQQQVLVLQKQ
jgi:hypothetical protein